MTQKSGVVMVVEDESQSQPCETIHYAYDEAYWKGQADVNCLNQSKPTQSQYERWV